MMEVGEMYGSFFHETTIRAAAVEGTRVRQSKAVLIFDGRTQKVHIAYNATAGDGETGRYYPALYAIFPVCQTVKGPG